MKKGLKLSKGALGAKIAFDEAKHKRGPGGKFADKPGAGNDAPKAPPSGKHSEALKAAGKTSGIKPTDVIKLHVSANPKKPGSGSAEVFSKYKNDMTVAEFKAAAGQKATENLAYDLKKGYISVHDPASIPKAKIELTKAEYVATAKMFGVKGTDVIKLHPTDKVGEMVNPKKPGSKSASVFGKYKDEMTVDEFVASVGDKKTALENIAYDKVKGFVSIHEPGDLAALRSGAKKPEVKAPDSEKFADPFKDTDLVEQKDLGTKPWSEWKQMYKDAYGADGAALLITQDLKKGDFKLAGSKAPEPASKSDLFKETDLIENTTSGTKKTAAQWKADWTAAGNNNAHYSLENGLKQGLFLNKTTPVKGLQVSDLKPGDTLALKATTNPYKEGTGEWIKFKAFSMNSGNTMTKAQYDATKALSPAEKNTVLQKLIDDGHVKLVAPGQVSKITSLKAASPVPIQKLDSTPKWEPNDERWKKAGGIKDLSEAKVDGPYGETTNISALEKAYDHAGVKYVHNNTHSAIASYTHSGYQSINGNLRKGGQPDNRARAIDKIIASSPPFAADTYMYRGMGSGSMMNDMPPPADFVDLGFTSVSFNPRVASGFGGKTSKHGLSSDKSQNIFRIRVPKGHPGISVSIGGGSSGKDSLSGEAEVILPRGGRYRYVSEEHHVTKSGSPIRVVELEIVNADGSPYTPKK